MVHGSGQTARRRPRSDYCIECLVNWLKLLPSHATGRWLDPSSSHVSLSSLLVACCVQTPVKALSSKKTSILSRIKNVDFQSSTKIEALREELYKMMQADPSAKAIVFSQFTSMLDLVSFRLDQVMPCLYVHG